MNKQTEIRNIQDKMAVAIYLINKLEDVKPGLDRAIAQIEELQEWVAEQDKKSMERGF